MIGYVGFNEIRMGSSTMRRAFQLTFVWFFAVATGFAWAGINGMAGGHAVPEGEIVLASAE